MSELRSKLIRLAHSKPELRGTLLPLLASQKQAAKPSPADKAEFAKLFKKLMGDAESPADQDDLEDLKASFLAGDVTLKQIKSDGLDKKSSSKKASGVSYTKALNDATLEYAADFFRAIDALLYEKDADFQRMQDNMFKGTDIEGQPFFLEFVTNGQLGVGRTFICRWSLGDRHGDEILKWVEYTSSQAAVACLRKVGF